MMKKPLFVALASVMVLGIAVFAYAEKGLGGPGFGGRGYWMSQLTPEQQDKMSALRLEFLKKTEPLRAEMGKKRIELLEITSKATPDRQALEQKIDEMQAIKDKMNSERRALGKQIRALLTPEQLKKAGPMLGMGHGGGFGHHGRGPGGRGCGMGPGWMGGGPGGA
ncbi:MAG: periplasmic heavy metal sensor [Desulfomonile sp.]|nr:periplasmic heavy metal sensor [Desulfomonile sp.]